MQGGVKLKYVFTTIHYSQFTVHGFIMSYIVLARKWRPQRFDELIGQEPVVTTIKNSISSGKIVHAYLFSGPRGVGKTSAARLLAKALNCSQGPTTDPCCTCQNCEAITGGSSIIIIEDAS